MFQPTERPCFRSIPFCRYLVKQLQPVLQRHYLRFSPSPVGAINLVLYFQGLEIKDEGCLKDALESYLVNCSSSISDTVLSFKTFLCLPKYVLIEGIVRNVKL